MGGTAGWVDARAKTRASTSDGFVGSYFTSPDPEQIAGEARGGVSQSSMAIGGFGGVGQQFGNLYVGVEASVNSMRFDETRSSGAVYLSNAAGTFVNTVSVKTHGQATLRARLGWIHDRFLTYVTGGVAAARVKMDASFSDNFLGTGASGRDTNKETRLGWVVGLGSEYALSDRWTIRADYLYADYGKIDTSAVITNPVFPALSNHLDNSIDLKTRMFSVGLSYRF